MKPKQYNLPGPNLLSYSGMTTYLACPRKYAHRYIDKIEMEDVDTSAMDRGRAFHLLAQHWGKVSDALLLHELDNDQFELAKVQDAFNAYVNMTQSGALPVLNLQEVKIVSEEHQFIGYVDGIKIDDATGQWMLGEIKTAARLDPVKWATLSVNQQISLYTSFAGEFAHGQFLDLDDLIGTSYRTVTLSQKRPSKGTKKDPRPEGADAFAKRIAGDSAVYHQMVKPTAEACHSARQSFEHVKAAVHDLNGDAKRAVKNSGNCYAYNRPCEYFAHCWGLEPEVKDDQLVEIDV